MKRLVERLLVVALSLSMTIGFLPQASLTALAEAPSVGFWIDNTESENVGEVKVTYDDGRKPESDGEHAGFAPGSRLKAVISAPEEFEGDELGFEIEFLKGPDVPSEMLNLDSLPEGDFDFNAENKVITVYFTIPEAVEVFCVRVFWDGMPAPSASPAVITDANDYLYAYSDKYDIERLKEAFATELLSNFVLSFKYDIWHIWSVDDMKSCIELVPADNDIMAKDASGVDITIPTYKASVHWGVNRDNPEEELVSELYVYALPEEGPTQYKSILICADYDMDKGFGSRYYVRNIRNDRVNFSPYVGDYDTNADNGILIFDDGKNAVIGGYDAASHTLTATDNCITIQTGIYPENEVVDHSDDYSVYIRFLNKEKTYVAVHSEGEDKKYDGLGMNGYGVDPICETGTNMATSIFVGDTKVKIYPLNDIGLGTTAIKNVALVDTKMADGVKIDNSTLSQGYATVEFLSNFYDSVKLNITYANGKTGELTINRIGLVIRTQVLKHDESSSKINYDCWGEGNDFSGPAFSYNFDAGEQILVFATYYHPTNYKTLSGEDNLKLQLTYKDGSKKMVDSKNAAHNFTSGFASGEPYGCVDTTSFIIGFIANAEDGKDVNYGEFNALVVNGGFDDANTFGGAQIGGGIGVYWDGIISGHAD